MRFFLEIRNKSYSYTIDAHLSDIPCLYLWFHLRNVCMLQDVEATRERAPGIRKIPENFLPFHFELLVRLIIFFKCLAFTHNDTGFT